MSNFRTLLYSLFSSSYRQSLRKNLPKLDENYYWGPGCPPSTIDDAIKPFEVRIDDQILDDLKSRLKNTRKLTPPLEGIKQDYGFNTKLLQKIIDYWINEYKWREREKELNRYPQFTTNIQGLNIHYLHVKPKSLSSNIKVYPLLILHGWPGSVVEFYRIIPYLIQPFEGRDFAFEVIAPSLPGFGFSDPSTKPGLDAAKMAVIFRNLMKRLGFERYYLQGGDWGSQINSMLTSLYPKNVLGLHLNMCISLMKITWLKIFLGSLFPRLVIDKGNEKKLYPVFDRFQKFLNETGYYHIQATKPDTIGVALNDSPAGLAAFILEKFSSGTNPKYKGREDGGLLEKYTYDILLDNVMLYWVTRSATTAARLYAEVYYHENRKLQIEQYPLPKEVPVAFLKTMFEVMYLPDNLLKDRYPNVIQSTEFPKYGHFLAMEEPEILAKDLFSAVNKMRRSRT